MLAVYCKRIKILPEDIQLILEIKDLQIIKMDLKTCAEKGLFFITKFTIINFFTIF